MIECKVCDYLTVTLLPGDVTCSIRELVDKLLEAFMIEDLGKLFRPVSQNFMYESILRYGDISLKIPYAFNYKTQGVCLEFSGQGIDYYLEYLRTHRSKADFRLASKRFLGLAGLGFKTRCSRFDVSMDEKHNKGDQEEPLLDLDVINDTLKSGCFVTKFRKADPKDESCELQSIVFTAEVGKIDKVLPYRYIESENLSTGRIGKTILLGKRKSNSFIRFYDKLAEQEAHKFEVPEDLASWIRFEIEFKGSRANSVFVEYAKSNSDHDFVNRIRSISLDMIRFIDFDRSRKYNCTICSWWYDFLCKAKAAKLVHNKPKYNKFVRAVESKKRQHAASFAAILKCNRQAFISIILEGFKKESKSAEAIILDYEAIKDLDPEEFYRVYKESTSPESGVDFWKHHIQCEDMTDDQFLEFMNECVESFCLEVEKVLESAEKNTSIKHSYGTIKAVV